MTRLSALGAACMPLRKNRDEQRRGAWFLRGNGLAARERPLPAGSDPTANVSLVMLVTRDGDVAYADLKRRSSVPTLNQAMLRAARTCAFFPARLAASPWTRGWSSRSCWS